MGWNSVLNRTNLAFDQTSALAQETGTVSGRRESRKFAKLAGEVRLIRVTRCRCDVCPIGLDEPPGGGNRPAKAEEATVTAWTDADKVLNTIGQMFATPADL